MQDLQPNMPSNVSLPVGFEAVTQDEDFALGFECADPSLQIERWMQEARGLDAA